MGAALTELNRYGRLVAEVDLPAAGQRFRIVQHQGRMWLEDMRSDPNAFPEMTEATWARFIGETRRHFPDAPFARSILVTHAAPDHRDSYAQILGVPVIFAAARNAVEIDPSWLGIELHNPSVYAFGVLSAHADQLMRSLENARTMRGQVEALLIPMLHRGEVAMETIAAQIGMSRQSLYRRLKAEGIGFETLLDDLRQRMAIHYLEGGRTSVNETGYLAASPIPAPSRARSSAGRGRARAISASKRTNRAKPYRVWPWRRFTYSRTFPRPDLTLARRALLSMRRVWDARVGCVGRRFFGTIVASRIRFRSRSRTSSRFSA